jgi:hypothetical protein
MYRSLRHHIALGEMIKRKRERGQINPEFDLDQKPLK